MSKPGRNAKGHFQSGPGNPLWRGGAMALSAKGRYKPIKWVQCPPEHAGMARKDGMVRQHRLVMAQRIGRDLFPWEVVHHKDHDPKNNAPENLELWPSNYAHKLGEHGKLLIGTACSLATETNMEPKINPALKSFLRPTAELHPNPRNPMEHTQAQLSKLERSIRRYGFHDLIVVLEDGTIIAGEGRWRVFTERLEWPAIPCLIFQTQDEAEAWVTDGADVTGLAEGFMIADNKIAQDAGWKKDLLEEVMASQQELGAMIEDLGFTGDEIARLFKEVETCTVEESEIPTEAKKAITQPGDIWTLGDHLLLCGDATLKKDMAKLFEGRIPTTAQLVFTDPPYGISYTDREGKHEAIAGDDLRDDDLVALVQKAAKWASRYTTADAAFYVWHSPTTREDFRFALHAAGLQERQYLIWIKEAFTLGGADYQHGYEPCFYLAKAGQKPKFTGDRAQSTVWRMALMTTDGELVFDLGDGLKISSGDGDTIFMKPEAPKGSKHRKVRLRPGQKCYIEVAPGRETDAWQIKRDPGSSYQHPTQKPVGLAERAIRNSSDHGDAVLDPFAGSGSTLLAAHKQGRQARLIELEPAYCDIIVERFEQFTGGKAKRTKA